MTYPSHKGQSTTADNPGNSKLMLWFAEHRDYKSDACLLWPFGRNSTGYGTMGRKDKMFYAHRYMCELTHGQAPAGYQASHSCGRGADGCCNPKHITWKTPSENQKDRVKHGTATGRRRKLTEAQVAEIRARGNIEQPASMAARFGVTEANIRQIISGKTWRVHASPIRPALP